MGGDELRTARRARSLSQQELADALRVHRVTVARWETGAIIIPPRMEIGIRYVLGMEMEAKGA